MKHETILNKFDEEFIYEAIEKYRPGDSIQDKFLRNICDRMFDDRVGIEKPQLVFDSEKYNFVENYRRIICERRTDKVVYAYFDHPVENSPLYVATFDEDVKKQLLSHVRALDPYFRMTPFNSLPLTIKIGMNLFCNASESNVAYWDKQTLRYLETPVVAPEFLFDVVDFEGLPMSIVENIR